MDWKWLESTRKLQEEAYDDHDWPKTGQALADSVMMNVTALTAELGEFAQEVGWKPWASPRGWVNRDAAVKELIDVGHFLANLACALGVTDEEWERLYRAKQQVNRQRQVDGYDGVSTKCASCKRALDDVGVTKVERTSGFATFMCNGCGESVEQAQYDAIKRRSTVRVTNDTCPGCGAIYGAPTTRCLRDGNGEAMGVAQHWCANRNDFVV